MKGGVPEDVVLPDARRRHGGQAGHAVDVELPESFGAAEPSGRAA